MKRSLKICVGVSTWAMIIASAAAAQVQSVETAREQQAIAQAPGPNGETGQESGAAATGDEIIVTALKRNVALQDTPATIQAIEPAQVRNAQVAELTNIGRLVPSMQIYTSPLGTPALFLYGMGTSATGATFEQSVMPFFNGVANGHARSLQVGLYDLSSIEVVKGTQSILGKNASLGALLVNTQLPRQEFEAAVIGRYEFNLNSPYVEASINLPVSETLAVRVAGQSRRDGGWVRNFNVGRNEPETTSWSVRGSLLWQPTDTLDVSVVYQHDERRQRGTAFESVGFSPGAGNGQALCALAGVVCDFTSNYQNQQGPSSLGSVHDDLDSDRVVGTATLDVNDMTLTSISGYINYRSVGVIDIDQMPLPLLASRLGESDEMFSQELRLASDETRRLRWLVGLYYAHDSFNLPIRTVGSPAIVRNGTTLWSITGTTLFGYDQVTQTMSAFGQAFFEINDQFEIAGGVRYTDETRKVDISNTAVVPGVYSTVLKPPFPAVRLSRNDATPDYNVSLRYQPSSDVTLYVSYGKGTKSGGFNNQPLPRPTYQAFRNDAEFAEETARTLEGGVKLSLPGIGFFNLSAFNVEVKNFQASTSVGPLLVYLSRDQRSRGATLDTNVRPLQGISLRASVTYADTRDTTANLPLTYAPKWSGIVGADFDRNVGGLKLGGGVELEFRSSQFNRQPSSSTPPATEFIYNFGSAQRLNARLAIGSADDRYELALLGRNLTDERIIDSAYGGTGFSGYGASYERPRTVALQLTARY